MAKSVENSNVLDGLLVEPGGDMRGPDLLEERLAKAGWRTGSVSEFLGMSTEETLFMEMRIGLKRSLREFRRRSGLTQAEVAERAGSGQSRIAKLEAGDPKATIDLLIRAVVAAGGTPKEVADVFIRAAERATEEESNGVAAGNAIGRK